MNDDLNTAPRLKILLVTRGYIQHGIGGMERHGHDVLTGLVQRGHQARVITTSSGDKERETVDGIDVQFIRESPPRVYSPEYHAGVKREIEVQLKSWTPDLLISQGGGLMAYLAERPPGTRPPAFTIAHGTIISEMLSTLATAPRSRRLYWLLRRQWPQVRRRLPTERAYLGNSEVVVGVSEYVCESVNRDLRVPAERIRLIRPATDLNYFKSRPETRGPFREKLGLGPEHLVLLAIGRFDPDKGFATAVRAFAQIAEKHPNARLLLVGDGPERALLEQLAGPMVAARRIIFTGRVPQPETVDYYNIADISLIPSLRYEGLPATMIEAAAFGHALLVTRRDGQKREIDHGRNGLLFKPGSVSDCRRKLEMLLSDEALRQRLGEAALSTAQQRYGMDKMIDLFEQCCYDVAAMKKPVSASVVR